MIKTSDVFISIPKTRNTSPLITVNGEDVTSKVLESSWSKPLLNFGIGGFRLKLINIDGHYSARYSAGDPVLCYLDNSDGTTKQFHGRIDYPKESLAKEGQFLEIVGRHRSFFLSERRVCYRAEEKDCSEILKEIIDLFASECTYTNVNTSGVETDVNWDYKPFYECVNELMQKSNYDCYVDDELDFYFFEANSILNEDEAIAEGDNFLRTEEVGNDDYYEKTRVTVIGKDDEGIPVIYTAINGIDDDTSGREEDGVREVFVRDLSANTLDKVKILAQSELSKYTNRAKQGIFYSFGLETLKQGENLWISVPRQKIMGIYKAVEIKHLFGSKVGGWRTETLTEHRAQDTNEIFSAVMKKNDNLSNADNYNKLNYSYNETFDDESGTDILIDCTILDGAIRISDGKATGTWASNTIETLSNITKLELRAVGTNLGTTKFYYSLDGGYAYTQLYNRTLLNVTGLKSLKIKAELSLYSGASPEIKSLAILYS